jgi:hypothetical protein
MLTDKVMQPAKLTLNLTYPVLEKLIGGDSEIEVQIRSQIADRFLKNYLKKFVSDERIQQLRIDVNKSVDKQIAQELGFLQGKFFSESFQLNPKYTEIILKKLKESLDKIINEAIKQVDITSLIEAKMKQLIEINMDMINKRIDEVAKKIIDNNVAVKLKGLLE